MSSQADARVPADALAQADMSFSNDPLDTRFAELEATQVVGSLFDAITGEAPLETGFATHLFGQGHAWDTAPLAAPVRLCGIPSLQLELRTDTPDADLLAALLKVRDDGRAVVLSSSLLRLRHRDGLNRPVRLMTPAVAETVNFPKFRFVSTEVDAGCRLRLVVRVPASIAFERQVNSATPVGEQTLAEALRGLVTVHAGERSQLLLPLLDDSMPQSDPTA
jgi:hypothetical protein